MVLTMVTRFTHMWCVKNINNFSSIENAIKVIPYSSILCKSYCTVDNELILNTERPNNKINKAMKVLMKQAQEYNEFIKKTIAEYDIGKRHLANMMGEDPDNFSEADVNRSIKYLFPSGLYEPHARPMMINPDKLVFKNVERKFDKLGRPHHFLHYTTKPNYYEVLHKIAESMEILNKIEDEKRALKILPSPEEKFNIQTTEWMSQKEFQAKFSEHISILNYEYLITSLERVLQHPFSIHATSLLNDCRKEINITVNTKTLPQLSYDDNNRPYILLKQCSRKSAKGDVKVIGNGTGNITINGEDISYFKDMSHREQVIFPLIFTNMSDKVDVEATVSGGGPSGHAGIIRWGIAKALRNFVSEEMIEKMRIAGLLTHDSRSRERKKYGQEGARRKFTWRKR